MLFKILFIIMVSYTSGLINPHFFRGFSNKMTSNNIILYDTNYGTEFDLEMSKEEIKLHKDINTEEEKIQFTKDVIQLQKYQTMYKLLKYLIDNEFTHHEKIMLLNIFKKEINDYIF